MKLVAIVLNYINWQDSAACVKRLLEMKIISDVVLVDNASPNNSWDNLQRIFKNQRRLHLIKNAQNGGYGYGNNRGAYYADMELSATQLMITNPDVTIEESAVAAVSSYLETHKEYAAIAPAVDDSSGITQIADQVWNLRKFHEHIINMFSLLKHFFQKNKETNISSASKIIQGDCISGACLFVRTEVFRQVGGYDERLFLFGEENVLGKKFKDAHYKSGIMPQYLYKHEHSGTIDTVFKLRAKMHLMNKSRRFVFLYYSDASILQKAIFNIIYPLTFLDVEILIFKKIVAKYFTGCRQFLVTRLLSR